MQQAQFVKLGEHLFVCLPTYRAKNSTPQAALAVAAQTAGAGSRGACIGLTDAVASADPSARLLLLNGRGLWLISRQQRNPFLIKEERYRLAERRQCAGAGAWQLEGQASVRAAVNR